MSTSTETGLQSPSLSYERVPRLDGPGPRVDWPDRRDRHDRSHRLHSAYRSHRCDLADRLHRAALGSVCPRDHIPAVVSEEAISVPPNVSPSDIDDVFRPESGTHLSSQVADGVGVKPGADASAAVIDRLHPRMLVRRGCFRLECYAQYVSNGHVPSLPHDTFAQVTLRVTDPACLTLRRQTPVAVGSAVCYRRSLS